MREQRSLWHLYTNVVFPNLRFHRVWWALLVGKNEVRVRSSRLRMRCTDSSAPAVAIGANRTPSECHVVFGTFAATHVGRSAKDYRKVTRSKLSHRKKEKQQQ